MNTFLEGNSYHTPQEQQRHWLDKMSLNSSVYFILSFIRTVLRTRPIAVRGKYDKKAWIDSSHDIFRLIERCGGKFHITGLDNLRMINGPVVIISNHMSTLETMIFPGLIAPFRDVTFVVKDSLVKHPFFGPVMRSRNPIVVSRANSRDDLMIVLNKGLEYLAKGISIVIFPQSTRHEVFNPQEFNSLGVKLAARAGVPIIPVAIKTDFWKNGRIFKDLGPIDRKKPIQIEFEKPLIVNGSGKEENAKIIEFISSRLQSWGGIFQAQQH
jgi:1-acyl-sn-glycerol-3-phosphate acyltransferase